MESNRLTIIVKDNAVYRDQGVFMDLDLSNCGIPQDVHALQWNINEGHIEYAGPIPNVTITELPQWATNCIAIWEISYQQMLEAQAAAQLVEETPPE